MNGKTITLVGDLLNGRTVHSLVQLIARQLVDVSTDMFE